MRKALTLVFLVVSVAALSLISIFSNSAHAQSESNLVGYWKFDDCTAKDSSGYGNDGVVYGATCVDGKIDTALNFDGINDYVDLGNSSSLNTTSFTVSFWLNLTSDPNCDTNNNWRSLIRKGSTAGTGTGWDIALEEDRSLKLDIGNGTNWQNRLSTSSVVPVGVWTHLVFAYNQTTGDQRIYKNGVSIASRTVTGFMQPNTQLVLLSKGTNAVACPNQQGYANGIFDEIHIYDRALSEEEIKTLYWGRTQEETISINVTEETIGGISKLTWGSNFWSILNDDCLYDGLPRSELTLGRIDMDLNHIFPTSTSPPKFDWIDKMINATKKVDIEPLLIVDYMPKWLSKNTSSTMYPPTNLTKFSELVAIVVDHVKNNVTYYEIWNEPDLTKFWNGTEIEYRDLLINVSQVIRGIDPDAKILAPSSSDVYFSGKRLTFLQEVCVNASNYFDIISFHAYSFPPDKWPSLMNDFKQKLNEFGCGNKPLWMTEGGFRPEHTSWNYVDILLPAKARKALLDFNVEAQVYYPFQSYMSSEFGYYQGLYNSSNKIFTPIGKFYQLMGQLKFYGEKLNMISNIQNDISTISFISVKNSNNDIIVQLTNSFSTSKEVRINFQDVKGITVHESSSDQIFASPSYLDKNSSLNLTLKPYSVYLINAKPSAKILGQLKNATNNPVQANVIIYDQGTSNLNTTGQTGIDGSYSLSVLNGIYDIQYNILNFFIPNFWIKLLSINVTSEIHDLVNYIIEYPSENKVSFIINSSGTQTIQTYSSNKPKRVKINQTEIPFSDTLSSIPSWRYDSTNKIIILKFSC